MFIEKGPTDCWPWQLNPEDAPYKGLKMACNESMCCNPRHISPSQEDQEVKRRGRPPKVKDGLQADSLAE